MSGMEVCASHDAATVERRRQTLRRRGYTLHPRRAEIDSVLIGFEGIGVGRGLVLATGGHSMTSAERSRLELQAMQELIRLIFQWSARLGGESGMGRSLDILGKDWVPIAERMADRLEVGE